MVLKDYMEDKLTRLDKASRGLKFTDVILPIGIAIGFFVLITYVHIGVVYKLWTPDKGHIDRNNCTCSCFDTVFRGAYEYPVSGYKHVYFNATKITLKIFALTVVFIILVYESIRHMFLIYRYSRVRYTMFVLVLVSIYPNYYSWWSYFSYLNEEFFNYFYHDIFFVLTEIISTFMAINLMDRRIDMSPTKLLVILDINIVHILVSGLDQFIEHVILRKGHSFQNYRNWGLLIPDFIFVAGAFFELYRLTVAKRKSFKDLFYKEELMLSMVFILIATVFVDMIQY